MQSRDSGFDYDYYYYYYYSITPLTGVVSSFAPHARVLEPEP